MEINNLDDLKTVIQLLSEGKAYYFESICEGVLELRYNKEKKHIEEYIYQNNPYSGEVKEQTKIQTIEEVFNSYKDHPGLWRNFSLY